MRRLQLEIGTCETLGQIAGACRELVSGTFKVSI